ncbi:hypothetical protein [Desulfosarcina ovata]|uniref:Uncharacterized protein n=1 Tax=Desulfosarcina ovata subsp. ovata TaxID=2752305 RepID=A0A5K8AMD5_9BACT|nr:hypothetical protein [Desulfosarcina ovata]BBO92990.1 hypothetical protein DSCOOX_61700 [Desulfosarcina ovata subsp. ovata]
MQKNLKHLKPHPILLSLLIAMPVFAVSPGSDNEGDETGKLPDRVVIKTPLQSFNRFYYFALKDGRIYYKPNAETTGKQGTWKLFLATGLPGNKSVGDFPVPSSVKSIYADADEIIALSDAGRFYWLRLGKGISWEEKIWNHLWGWPEKEPLFLTGPASSPVGWAIGRRNRDVLYHEDIDGNPHHFGTMGITTLYVLNSRGREIRFTDSGLPADFSHTICLPNRGKFVAENISVSASTIFVIDAAGDMYTRLIDFDTSGSDPMFFKYSYKREKRHDNGEDWGSNFTKWSLPAEGWRKQPGIDLKGRARLSSMITILQNGHGNAARELRMAGINEDGNTGYYYKNIFDDAWSFSLAELTIPDSSFLKEGKKIDYSKLKNSDFHYRGKIRRASVYLGNVSAELLNFNLTESPSILRIIENGRPFDITFYTVESWTYLKRIDPGRDGVPKIFLGTLEFPVETENNSHGYGPVLRELKKQNLKTFRFLVEATTDYVYIKPRSEIYTDIEMIFAAKNLPFRHPMVARTYSLAVNGFNKIASSDDLIIESLSGLSSKDIPLLKKKIKKNREAISGMKSIMKRMKRASKELSESSLKYKFFYTLVNATGLVFLDKPKIWTSTRHFGAILKSYKDSYKYLYFVKEQDYDQAVAKIESRIDAYSHKIHELNGKSKSEIFYSEKFFDYFEKLGIKDEYLSYLSLSGVISARCDVSPVKKGYSFFFIRLGKNGICNRLTFIVELPEISKEMLQSSTEGIVEKGKFEALLTLFNIDESPESLDIYKKIFLTNYPAGERSESLKALLKIEKGEWQLYDTSGFSKNQVWLKGKRQLPL